jgi:hypothetical protein
VRKNVKPVSNWRRPLPRPIVLPDVPLKLPTIADVRDLVHKRLPPQYKAKDVWQRVAVITAAAARGELPAEEVMVALRMVLAIEGLQCRVD